MSLPPTSVFRILVVDDEKSIYEIVRDNLSSYDDVARIDFAQNADEASELLGQSLYDLALLDLYGQDDLPIGTEVIRRMDAADLSTRVLLMTKFELKEDARRLLQLTGSPSAWRLAGFIDKQYQFASALKIEVGKKIIETFLAREPSILGLESVVTRIKKQRGRYRSETGDKNLRTSRVEIATEVDRLLRKLYVDLPGGAKRESHVSITLEPMERHGLSAAVVANATVEVRFNDLDRNVGGHKTVLKVGPKNDIFDEAARFHEYVRYGVELAQRVELLAVAGVDALGGLVYSFAGGLYNNDLLPLDKVLVEDLESGNLNLSTVVLNSLFSTTNWYSVTADPQGISDYFDRNYSTNLRRSSTQAEKYLLESSKARKETGPWVEKIEEATSSYLNITTASGSDLVIPDASILGWGVLLYNAPACLVHGDMHGGNVLLESSLEPDDSKRAAVRKHHRTCLIDFRNAGPGPRCIDAVCLESSIRLADAESISRRHVGEDDYQEGLAPARLVSEMVDRFEAEKALYRAVFLDQGRVPDMPWANLSAVVLRGLMQVFTPISLREYLATSVRYAIRNLGFPLSDLARYRVVAWLAAQYALAKELENGS